jgi:type II pantothenate kinase
MSKITLSDNDIEIPSDRIGIDMGQSLTKFAYLDGNDLNLSTFNTQTNIADIKLYLNSLKDQFKIFNFTGGRSYDLFTEYLKNFKSNLINEFEANMRGIKFLYSLEKKKELPRSLIVSIGTGTSIILKNDTFQHLGGSALGGGFFMGLINIIFNLNDFQEIINLAKKGNRYNVDLRVSDIYHPDDNRVDLLFREFTAASLGKINENFNTQTLKKEDFINSIICLIGENLGTIANVLADNNNVTNIVFCGGFLRENKTLKKILSLLCKVNKKKGIFLRNSEFCAAIGALLI